VTVPKKSNSFYVDSRMDRRWTYLLNCVGH
jgi:hypothetical protein